MRRKGTSTTRRLIGAAFVVSATAVAIEWLARRNLRSEQAKRASLGRTLYRQVQGRGDAVVFIAGFQGSTRYWGESFEPAASSHRLIFLDVLGFGRSPWPASEYTLDDHLDAIRRTLEEEGATARLTLVAHSFGAVLAAYYAARHPFDVSKIVLLGTPVFRGREDAEARLWEMSPLAALFSLNPLLSRVSCTVMCAFRPLLQRVVPFLRHDLDSAVVSDGTLHMWSSVEKTLKNVLLSQPVERALAVIGRKAVLLHGLNDRVTPLENVREVCSRTGARLIETDDTHHTYLEKNGWRILEVLDADEKERDDET